MAQLVVDWRRLPTVLKWSPESGWSETIYLNALLGLKDSVGGGLSVPDEYRDELLRVQPGDELRSEVREVAVRGPEPHLDPDVIPGLDPQLRRRLRQFGWTFMGTSRRGRRYWQNLMVHAGALTESTALALIEIRL